MNKQTDYLISEIEKLIQNNDLKIKYEFNSDINIHFVLIVSNTLELSHINEIADLLYVQFTDKFPGCIVAIMDQNDKYDFRFKTLFDNTVEETASLYFEANFDDSNHFNKCFSEFVEITKVGSKRMKRFSNKSEYRESISFEEFKSDEYTNTYDNEEIALAA